MTRRLTLTFDNGPTPGVTERVLEELARRDIRSTFFVVGRDLERDGSRALARQAKDAGHWIGNHSMTHSVLLGSTDDPGVAAVEIDGAQEVLADLAEPAKLFRPWGGGGTLGPNLLSRAAVDLLTGGGYTLVLWNCVPHDWEDASGWVDRALADIAVQDWTVLVVHDIASGAMDNLGTFLNRAASLDVTFTQDFPDACAPIRRGRIVGVLDGYVRNGLAGGQEPLR